MLRDNRTAFSLPVEHVRPGSMTPPWARTPWTVMDQWLQPQTNIHVISSLVDIWRTNCRHLKHQSSLCRRPINQMSFTWFIFYSCVKLKLKINTNIEYNARIVAQLPLLALRSIQFMAGEPGPRYGAFQLLGKSGDCGQGDKWMKNTDRANRNTTIKHLRIVKDTFR